MTDKIKNILEYFASEDHPSIDISLDQNNYYIVSLSLDNYVTFTKIADTLENALDMVYTEIKKNY